MKKGEPYLHSAEKRAFDVSLALLLLPADLGARAIAKATFCREIDLLYSDERIGRFGLLEHTVKIQTLDPATHTTPISHLAETFRAKGLDELPQIMEVLKGTMSFFGRRRLLPDEENAMRVIAGRTPEGRRELAIRDALVVPAKPGIISTLGFVMHTEPSSNDVELAPEIVLRRLKLDNQDHAKASLRHDVSLLIKGLAGAIRGELVTGSVGMPEA